MTYIVHFKENFLSILISRVAPMLGVTLIFALLARHATLELASFSYVLASLSVMSSIASMGLAAIGNLAAAASAEGQDTQRFFSTGLFLAVTLAGIGITVALAFPGLAPLLPGAQRLDPYLLEALSLTYAACIPFTIVNFFFQTFFEGTGSASFCAMMRTACTLIGVGYLMCIFLISDGRGFALLAAVYFILVESLCFFCFLVFARRKLFRIMKAPCKDILVRCLSNKCPHRNRAGRSEVLFFHA